MNYIITKELINGNEIKYIINERKNQKHTKEINECYYFLLTSICYINKINK